MSQQLINHSSDLKRLRDEGYQLEIYGGHLPINSFRSSFGKLSYGETSNIKKPFMYCAGIYFEERLLNS